MFLVTVFLTLICTNVNAIPCCSGTLLAKLRDVGIADIEIIAAMSPLDLQRICGIPDGDGLAGELVDLFGTRRYWLEYLYVLIYRRILPLCLVLNSRNSLYLLRLRITY